MFSLPHSMGRLNRPIVGLDVGADEVFAVASYDDDDDFGPFRSAVFRIGRIEGRGAKVYREPAQVTLQEGFKVEAVARAVDYNLTFFGTDDENFGGVLRPLLEPSTIRP